MQTMTIEEFRNAVKEQDVPREHFAFKCPMCGTVQSSHDLIKAGAGKDFEEVFKYLGFSCFGRFTKAGPPRKTNDGQPCNWTLGGLLRMHKLEVVDDEGTHHPHFEPATKIEANIHMADSICAA